MTRSSTFFLAVAKSRSSWLIPNTILPLVAWLRMSALCWSRSNRTAQHATLLWRSEREWYCQGVFDGPRGCGRDRLATMMSGPSTALILYDLADRAPASPVTVAPSLREERLWSGLRQMGCDVVEKACGKVE